MYQFNAQFQLMHISEYAPDTTQNLLRTYLHVIRECLELSSKQINVKIQF